MEPGVAIRSSDPASGSPVPTAAGYDTSVGRRAAAQPIDARFRAIARNQPPTDPSPDRTSPPGPRAQGTSPGPPLLPHLDPTSTGEPPRRSRRPGRTGRPGVMILGDRSNERASSTDVVATPRSGRWRVRRIGAFGFGRHGGLPVAARRAPPGQGSGRKVGQDSTPLGPTSASWLVPAGNSGDRLVDRPFPDAGRPKWMDPRTATMALS